MRIIGGRQWSSWKAFQEQAIDELIQRRGFSFSSHVFLCVYFSRSL